MLRYSKDYELFKFKPENRKEIDKNHVKKLARSIASHNMLDICPIIVNEQMEIMDGQHRFYACKELNIEVVYVVKAEMKAIDIVTLNCNSKAWGASDYLNFYIHQGNQEYRKLENFMKIHNISIRVAINITMGQTHSVRDDFKEGKFIFSEEDWGDEIDICWQTIDMVKRLNGGHPFLKSTRFWRGLLKLVRHPDFDSSKWFFNLTRMCGDVMPKRTSRDYVEMLQKIYNWKNSNKIKLEDESETCDI